MKCYFAVLLLALIALAMAAEKSDVNEKSSQVVDAARDKRGLAYYSPYAYSPYAYSAYHLPYAYSPYAYSYRYHYPYYNTPYYY
ncbi:hypothetical protein PUN28_002754 [Cardiocondyla obscurior]|uniref:Uncharacterized protein n=1 Tax=Cardiocondyla obscurior TaxID=286306 RepID=A0AAW2GVW4_9HYME